MNNWKPSLAVKTSLLFRSVEQTQTSFGDAMLKAVAKKEHVPAEALAEGVKEVFQKGVK
jgi:hypothetical protein